MAQIWLLNSETIISGYKWKFENHSEDELNPPEFCTWVAICHTLISFAQDPEQINCPFGLNRSLLTVSFGGSAIVWSLSFEFENILKIQKSNFELGAFFDLRIWRSFSVANRRVHLLSLHLNGGRDPFTARALDSGPVKVANFLLTSKVRTI